MTYNIRSYEYDGEDIITVKLDTGGKVKINMVDKYLAYYGCNCDIELDFISDDLKDLFFMVDGHCRTALALVQWAQNHHHDIVRDGAQEAMEEEAMARELSSLYLTGRI